MPQLEHVPHGYHAVAPSNNSKEGLRLQSTSGDFVFTFEALRQGLFRTTFISPKHLLPPHRATLVPQQIIDQESLKSVNSSGTSQSFVVDGVTANADWTSGLPLVSLTLPGHDTPLHSDLPHRSYVADGTGIAHYTRYNNGTLHLGLGEKPAPMDLSNRHFVLSATDSFGYDVYRTDPMYKHIPLLINATPDGCVGIFSTSHARGYYSVGSEMDGMWGRFKVYRQEYGGLEEYLIVGKTLKEVVGIYADLVGYPMLVPRWAFGYLAGGMKYSMLDDPRASDVLMKFAGNLKKHNIPCSGFQMSSGYTVAETEPKTRNVFTWNRHRFPDPKGFIDAFHREGIRLIANVKPYVLESHPEYNKLKAAGAFFTDSLTVASAEARLWSAGGGESGIGGHIDFTSKAGYKWWYEGIRELKRVGIDCIWNDNNEYTIPHDGWQCELTEPTVIQDKDNQYGQAIGFWGRALNTELMGKSSHDASLDIEPNQRPFILTRSATAGTLRYCASSWSGDNVTSWDGMKGANALSLTAGMCLMQCYGHDIGGFEGPQPSPELLTRWCQQGIYSPRFAINCYKTSPDNNTVGDVIEPWMYEETTPLIRDIIKRRYELIPYLYSLSLDSHQTATPPQRWTGWGYEQDPEVWKNKVLTDGETQYWLGDALLIGGVFEAGASSAKMYLPKDPSNPDLQFLDLNNTPQSYYVAGQWVDIPARWTDSIPVLARVGSAVPVGRAEQVLSVGDTSNHANLPLDDYRAVEIFPPKGSSNGKIFNNTWFEDDGVSSPPVRVSTFNLHYSTTDDEVQVKFSETLHPGFKPHWCELDVIVPAGEGRGVRLIGKPLVSVDVDAKGRTRWTGADKRQPGKVE
ncbi:glycoside hydrolase family 31 protein [Cucurbitaria berberidis CBS 394.84]|uniref:alpha-glucosidase n=1 Tax=Cucurbitaria berberidis CBS 394.84 TaxID=1168544 RepID=A0A9P4GKF8_9PLEO|nr:glycoside hydrolase family 31 protein [Cucurbitaria berberidis CBS 394.84]KAF1847277.1 glycoside hydrolase family 31 protein [Cucurbitaria berberidis CBS 394.84]